MSDSKFPLQDSFHRFIQAGPPVGVQLVRITGHVGSNRYSAKPVEFDSGHNTRLACDDQLTVTNLAEQPAAGGAVRSGTEAVAIDVEGFWIIHISRPASLSFPARITEALGGASYGLMEQVANGSQGFADKADGLSVTGRNLAELSLGPGAAVEVGTLVMVTAVTDQQSPGVPQYVFDHPAYAKYLE